MPVVFSPGEPETRPLNPDSIVYTTAQKVADILGIGPGEAVAVSADSEADRVYVTGADYRAHGFAVGDTILIYSDAQALGIEKEITAVTEGGSNGVALYFTGSFSTSDYQSADNTYVQNQSSFTNGKTRGMKRSVVETRIKEVQDRIDNITHNAWRPYLVSAEYLNFDTYKPYRRRYYTDYVGTVPLLFRNIQQILRLEVWQGDDYRELAGAEARVEVVDESALENVASGVLINNGGGYSASHTSAMTVDGVDATTKFAVGDFVYNSAGTKLGTVTAVGSTSVTIGAGIAATVANDAELYVAGGHLYIGLTNGSYVELAQGPGTSQWDARFDNVSAAQSLADLFNKEDRVSKSSIDFSPSFTLAGSTSNVAIHDEVLATANSDYGNGKIKLTSMRQTKGGQNVSIASTNISDISISDVTEATTTSSSVSSDVVTVTSTSGFASGGMLMVGSGSSVAVLSYTGKTDTTFTGCANVIGTPLTTLNTGGTTVFQYLFKSDIGAYSDAGGDQARLKDWWLDHEMGIIYFNNSYPFFEWNAVKASYIYGERYVEKAIEEAATKMVAADLLMSDDRSVLIPEGSQNVDLGSKIQLYRKEAADILSRYKEVVVFS
tara:strand:+ start:16835 stop:18658 length:1824 start_codon:yes stop_codon:yes gene_type:complete